MSMVASLKEEIHNCISSQQITPFTEIQEKTVPIVLGRRSWTADCIDCSTT
jgi:hypothetical protein